LVKYPPNAKQTLSLLSIVHQSADVDQTNELEKQ